jgi:hypothetical protein
MKQHLLAAMVVTLCSVSCFSPDSGPPPDGYAQPFSCEQLSSCATCTPVLGCGWCQSGDKGICVADPDQCARVASFSWTWELAFCPAEPDGGADAHGGAGDAAGEPANDATSDRASDAD